MKLEKLLHAITGCVMLIFALSANANTYNVGTLDATPYGITNPYINNVFIPTSGNSFLDTYNFSLNNTNLVSNSLNQLSLAIGAVNVLNINNLTMDLYNSSNGMLAGITGVTSSGQITTVLGNGSYYIDIYGIATGSAGGNYTLSAVAQPIPEPGEWLLILCGLCLIGYIATHRKNISSNLNSVA